MATVSITSGSLTCRLSSRPSRWFSNAAVKRKVASPGFLAWKAKRASTLPSPLICSFDERAPMSSTPEASALTSRVPPVLRLLCTTTPASMRSPTRTKRGRVGSISSGLLTFTWPRALPKRESLLTAMAIRRKVVRLSGSLKVTRALPLSSVTTEGV